MSGNERTEGREPLTREEFEEGYAERSGMTVEQIGALGLSAEPCDCGASICLGWQMAHADDDELPPPSTQEKP